ncbi:MAG: preprotein translocase subunit SecG [Clostridia bacterium]
MTIIEIILGIFLIIFALGLIAAVLLQEGHQKNVGSVMGGAETFFSKNKARSIEGKLERLTKFIAYGFFGLVVIINVFIFFT